MKNVLLTLLAVVVVIVGVVLATIYSGMYDVAATAPGSRFVDWALATTMDRSVARHARGILVPKLDDPAQLTMGFQHYREMCVECHGAPGVAPEELAQGLEPRAPNLSRALRDASPEQVFWVIKHGIRMTGMPAWGPTHDDAKIWAMVAFALKLPKMTPAEYAQLATQAEPPGKHE